MAKGVVLSPRLQTMRAAAMLLSAMLGGATSCGNGKTDPYSLVELPPPGALPGTHPELPPPPLTTPPPPISGGTLLILRDGVTAVAADPDRDSVWIADLATEKMRTRIRTEANAEPGRAVEDEDGNVHVALRRGGKVLTINPRTGMILSTRKVCAAPRGIAYDSWNDNLHVACAGGELNTLKARGGDVFRSLFLGADLRDVVISGNHLLVSRFRSAELLEVDAAGTVIATSEPRRTMGPNRDRTGTPLFTAPNQAYRLAALPGGGAVMLHLRSIKGNPIPTSSYSMNPCPKGGIVSTAITTWGGALSDGVGNGGVIMTAAAPVDVAVSRDGKSMAIIGGSSTMAKSMLRAGVLDPTQLGRTDPCLSTSAAVTESAYSTIEYTAAAYDDKGALWVQARQPAYLFSPRTDRNVVIPMPNAEDRSDPGHRVFHAPTITGLACVSCHGEAGDDGQVWNFENIGLRRTQSLRGGLLATAPFHWDGDLSDLDKLMKEVFQRRMMGSLMAEDAAALGKWLDAQPLLPKSEPRDPQAVLRGKTLFEDPALRCASCHSGPRFTNNQTVNVGTGKALQVPSLLDVRMRAPYLHSGCGSTLRTRFDPACGGGDSHGQTSGLSAQQIDDLVAYLETL